MTIAGLAYRQAPVSVGLVDVAGRPFPLLNARVRAHAEGGIARTVLEQSYANPYDEALEVLYTMPLPADGSVIGYTIHLGEKRITGRIESRERAREAYQRALEEGHTAGLLEQERADTFTQRLGSLPPRARVQVEIEVLQLLAFRAATASRADHAISSPACHWEYRFPTVVGVRYEGAPGHVPDADRLDVDRAKEPGTPVRLELEMVIADGDMTLIRPISPSHVLRIEPDGETQGSRLTFQEPSLLDRDLVVHWEATTAEVGLRLVEGGGLAGDDGHYGLLTITPPYKPEQVFARDLTVLIDSSGSMAGPPLERAKEVVERLVGSLSREDRFEILAFSNALKRLTQTSPGKPTRATEWNIQAALAALRRLDAGGGTEMGAAIEEALRPLRSDSQRQVILLTDGYIGFESEVVGNILRKLPKAARLHTVGIGKAPNRTLTRAGARAGRGVEVMVGKDEDIEHAAERLLQATLGPVLTDVSIDGGAVRSIAPERPGDVLAGQPLVVAVELEPNGGILEVGGRLAGRRKAWSHRVEVLRGSLQQTQLPVGALFGREAIEDQEMHLAAAGQDGTVPILAVIEKLGLRHRITSRRTSLVAISEEQTVDPKEPWRRQRLAVEMPAEVSAEGVGLLAAKAWTLPAGTYSEEELRVGSHLPPCRATSILGAPGQGKNFLAAVLGSERRMGTDTSPLARRTTPRNVRARCARVEKDLLIIEFETPHDGFQLPGASMRLMLRFKGRRKVEAEIDPERSTRPGRYDAGMTLRLALRTVDGSHWPRTDATVIIIPPTLIIPGTPEVPFVVLQVKIG